MAGEEAGDMEGKVCADRGEPGGQCPYFVCPVIFPRNDKSGNLCVTVKSSQRDGVFTACRSPWSQMQPGGLSLGHDLIPQRSMVRCFNAYRRSAKGGHITHTAVTRDSVGVVLVHNAVGRRYDQYIGILLDHCLGRSADRVAGGGNIMLPASAHFR